MTDDSLMQKKYEKAKDRFKMQRAKHADELHKVQKEHMEMDKRHWRSIALTQEEVEWERRLRTDAHELLGFVELEREFQAKVVRRAPVLRRSAPIEAVKRLSPGPEQDLSFQTAQESEEVLVFDEEGEVTRAESRETTPQTAETDPAMTVLQEPHARTTRNATPGDDTTDESHETAPSMRDVQTPKRQITRVPVHFGDSEDKENQTPQTVQDVLKAPLTIDRAAALAAIEYRRGRAKSFMNAPTPKKLELLDRRDVSAPPLITMSVRRNK